MYFINQNGSSLLHYGVKGMKWGVRRTPEQLGHKRTTTVQRYVEEALSSNTGQLSINQIMRLEKAEEKSLLRRLIKPGSSEEKALHHVDLIMDSVPRVDRVVPIRSLHTLQPRNNILRLNDVYDNLDVILSTAALPTVVRYKEKNLLSDGNHRANALLKFGKSDMKVQFYDYDEYLKMHKPLF